VPEAGAVGDGTAAREAATAVVDEAVAEGGQAGAVWGEAAADSEDAAVRSEDATWGAEAKAVRGYAAPCHAAPVGSEAALGDEAGA
jgi:hypothetical protein